ncbi:hypothetical protein [Neobacillus bataviensis]|uniref:hypothetical protein n=1 Tax=Neobacillus bataviensis TaxID=220685 RepID=UPI001CC04A6B|nr:hypothetical protein [Neobacillus bataviensis]
MQKVFNSKLIGLVIKRLSKVEVNSKISNQHELNGNRDLKQLLGVAKISNKNIRFTYYSRNNEELSDMGTITWYDAREAHPTRSEYRLYFKGNVVMDHAEAGDLLVVSLQNDGELNISIVQEGSAFEDYLLQLFGPLHNIGTSFKYKSL